MAEYHDTFLDGNELIEAAIERYYKEGSEENLICDPGYDPAAYACRRSFYFPGFSG